MDLIRSFLGWCSIISIVFYLFSAFILIVFKKYILNFHSKLFNLSKEELSLGYFKFLSIYKIVMIMFNIIPYLALVTIS